MTRSFTCAQQYACSPVILPAKTDPAKSFGDDVEALRNAMMTVTMEKNHIVIVQHFKGGQVGQSAVRNLTISKEDH